MALQRGLAVSFRIKDVFFDRAAIKKALKPANRKSLSQAGSFVQRASRSSIKRRTPPKKRKDGTTRPRKHSRPGTPPFAYSKHPFRTLKNILFGYDQLRDSVIVGPVGFGQAKTPGLHEYGGRGTRFKRVWQKSSRRAHTPKQAKAYRRLVRAGKLKRPDPLLIAQQANYPKRPYMQPSLERESPKFPSLWANSVAA